VLTDAAGRYEIPAVAGHLVVTATKAGYAAGTDAAHITVALRLADR